MESNTLPLSRILTPSCPSVRLLWIDTESHTDLLWNVSLLGLEEVHLTPGKSNEKLVTPVKNFRFLFFFRLMSTALEFFFVRCAPENYQTLIGVMSKWL